MAIKATAALFGDAPTVALIPIAELTPAPWNPRTIRDERFKNLCRSLEADPQFLYRRPILANAAGIVMAGNMRLRAAMHLKWPMVPCIREEVGDDLARERALRDNGSWGDWDNDVLALLLKDLEQRGSAVELLGFDRSELDVLLDALARKAAQGDPDAVPPTPETPFSRTGDVWLLGEHRVLCGSALDEGEVGRLMDARQADMLFTDPPYGVDLATTQAIPSRRRDDGAVISNDALFAAGANQLPAVGLR